MSATIAVASPAANRILTCIVAAAAALTHYEDQDKTRI
jgi:hypothetical protein